MRSDPAVQGNFRRGRALPLPWIDEPTFRCFGCSPRNPFGLALQMYAAGDGIGTDVTFREQYASYPGVVHGGVVSVVVDEVMGDAIALLHDTLAFSLALRTRYLEPVAVGRPYRCLATARVKGEGLFTAEAELQDVGGTAVVVASASFQQIRADQAAAHLGLDAAAFGRLAGYFSIPPP